MEIFWNKISLTGCKWSNLNTPSTETPVSHPLWGDSPFLIFSCGEKRIGLPSKKLRKLEIFWNTISLTGCKWSNLNAPSIETPVSHSLWGDSLFLIFSSWVIKIGLPSINIRKLENVWNKTSSTGCKWSSLSFPG